MNKKEKLKLFYDNYQGEKAVGFSRFYYRCIASPNIPMEILIGEMKKGRGGGSSCKSEKSRLALDWYDHYEGDKVNRQTFLQRTKLGYTVEESILSKDEFDRIADKRKIERLEKTKTQKMLDTKKIRYKKSDSVYDIRITYPQDVAKVFRLEYQKLINNVEEKINQLDDLEIVRLSELNTKLDNLQKELETFNFYNKI